MIANMQRHCAETFRDLHRNDDPLVLFNVWDVATALADATSQTLNRTSGSSFLCRSRKVSAQCRCILAIMTFASQFGAWILNQSMIRAVTSASRSRWGKCPTWGNTILL